MKINAYEMAFTAAVISFALALLWPWMTWIGFAAIVLQLTIGRIQHNSRMREMDRLWQHDAQVRKREILERLEGRHPDAP